jgi:hypothetical protein
MADLDTAFELIDAAERLAASSSATMIGAWSGLTNQSRIRDSSSAAATGPAESRARVASVAGPQRNDRELSLAAERHRVELGAEPARVERDEHELAGAEREDAGTARGQHDLHSGRVEPAHVPDHIGPPRPDEPGEVLLPDVPQRFLRLSPDGQRVLAGGPDDLVVWDLTSRQPQWRYVLGRGVPNPGDLQVYWTDDSRHIVLGQHGVVYVIRLAEAQ